MLKSFLCLSLILVVIASARGQTPRAAKPKTAKPVVWVDPDRTEPEGMKYKLFHSKTIDADVSYMVYLPPDYPRQTAQRYPVLYFLHGSGGTPRTGAALVPRLDKAIRAGRVGPLIVIFVNGLRGGTMYCDSRDGKRPLETVIVKDLIPHVDATYRTIASRAGRGVDGFSMGGFGAAHLGFKYPELFGVISIRAPALLEPELKATTPSHAWALLFPPAMGSDLEYFRANDPFTLAVKSADALRDRSVIRIVCHIEPGNWLAPQCDKLHQILMQHTIPHEFHYLSNVKSHDAAKVMETMGDAGFAFYTTAFERLQRAAEEPARPVTPAKPAKPAAGAATPAAVRE